jgi:hypothetical protein
MFIGKNAEHGVGGVLAPQLSRGAVWSLTLYPREGGLFTNIAGMRCTLEGLPTIALILRESEDCLRAKLINLGHESQPAVLKTGDEDELKGIGTVLAQYVCPCHFELRVVPV